MNDSNTSLSSGSLPVSSTTVRDSQYVTYGSVAGCAGHRLVYHNDSASDTNFATYGTLPENDYMLIVLSGAKASTDVL